MRSSNEIKKEIESRFGFFPPFFAPALKTPQILENLWQQTLSAYVENPLPALFKEKFAAIVARSCSVPYCLVCHSCTLRPLGMKAGAVLELLEKWPTPSESEINESLGLLAGYNSKIGNWPEADSTVEDAILHISMQIFTGDNETERFSNELRRVIGDTNYAFLILFIGYNKTCLNWAEAHTNELAFEADQRAKEHLVPLLEEEPQLGEFFKNYKEKFSNAAKVKTSQRELEDQRRRWMLGLKASKIGVWEYDLIGGSLHWDDEMFRLYGREPDDFEGAYVAWQKGLHPDDRESSEAELAAAIAGTKPYDTKFRIRAPDGTVRFLKAVAEVMRDGSGKAIKMIGVNIDVTRFEESERRIQETLLELQRSNAELESFAYIASHDLQAPLRHISSYADLLASKFNLDADPETAKWMGYIFDGTQTMKNLIDGLLTYSRVHGKEEGFEAVDLHGMVSKIATISMSASPGLTIEIPELPVVQGYASQLQQLFQNLIQNAVKFRRETVAPCVEIRYEERLSEHYFEVRDNGIGIPKEQFDRVFQLFQRLHNKEKYEGTGIGLSICKKVVGLHGGKIWIESEVGSGTTFCFTLKKTEGVT